MPEVAINIGDKKFTVTCQPGEESALESAASLLNCLLYTSDAADE